MAGSPLPQAARASFESRFGQDFGGVRVHTGNARCGSRSRDQRVVFTTGSEIYFGAGRFNPGTPEGDRLLAHELTHTIQQTGGRRARSGDTYDAGRARHTLQMRRSFFC